MNGLSNGSNINDLQWAWRSHLLLRVIKHVERSTCLTPSRPYRTVHNDRAGCRVYSPWRYHLSILTALCYTEWQLPDFSTYVHGDHKSTTNRTSGVWTLMYSMTNVYYPIGATNRSYLLKTVKHGRPAVAQFKAQNCACKNGSREPYSAPFGGYLSSVYKDLLRSTSLPNLKFLS